MTVRFSQAWSVRYAVTFAPISPLYFHRPSSQSIEPDLDVPVNGRSDTITSRG